MVAGTLSHHLRGGPVRRDGSRAPTRAARGLEVFNRRGTHPPAPEGRDRPKECDPVPASTGVRHGSSEWPRHTHAPARGPPLSSTASRQRQATPPGQRSRQEHADYLRLVLGVRGKRDVSGATTPSRRSRRSSPQAPEPAVSVTGDGSAPAARAPSVHRVPTDHRRDIDSGPELHQAHERTSSGGWIWWKVATPSPPQPKCQRVLWHPPGSPRRSHGARAPVLGWPGWVAVRLTVVPVGV